MIKDIRPHVFLSFVNVFSEEMLEFWQNTKQYLTLYLRDFLKSLVLLVHVLFLSRP